MLDHISNGTTREGLEALAQLHREGNEDAILAFAGVLESAADNPLGEIILRALAQIGKAPVRD